MPDTIPAGIMFTLSYGEYDDYYIYGLFRACVDISIAAVKSEFLRELPKQGEQYEFSPGEFVAWLRARPGFAEELDYCEWHIGDYSTIEFKLWD